MRVKRNSYGRKVRSVGLRLAVVVGVLVISLQYADNASAGRYSLKQCEGARLSAFSGNYAQLGGIDRVDVVTGCIPSTPAKIGVYQDRTGGSMAKGVGGEFGWVMPPGERVVSTEFDAKLRDSNGVEANLVGREIGTSVVSLDGGFAHDGLQRTAKWSHPTRSLEAVFVRLVCGNAGGCANQPSSQKAFFEVFDVSLEINDFRAPTLSASGTVWDWAGAGNWHRGSASLSASARDDGSGITRLWARVNGLDVDLGLITCPDARSGFAVSARPCPSAIERSKTLDTTRAPFSEGQNLITICAADFAATAANANQTCTATRNLWIDNVVPAEPIDLRPVGGSSWRAENQFVFTWVNPPDQASPITGGEYRIIEPESGLVVDSGEVNEASSGEFGPVGVPEANEFEFELRLRDAAGNLGRPARTTVRFDDRAPGDVVPVQPAGWISTDELPLRQVIDRAAPGGPSGVGGYALSVARSGPVTPCPTGLCLGSELTLSGGADDRTGLIPGLAEGDHWVSAVAASGAGVASDTPGSTLVKVDRTVPSVRIEGVPTGWVNRPVVVTANALDSASGMIPRSEEDDGEPATVIEVQDHAPYVVPGPSASFTVSGEGINRIRYWARDLAGNANDGKPGPDGSSHPPPGEDVVRIDTEPPRLTFDSTRNPDDPELIRVQVRDQGSGVASAVISLRRAGTADRFSDLRTDEVDGWFEARIPSDDLPAGSYEIRAEGTDRAGNAGIGLVNEIGSPMLLKLPLKKQVRLQAGFGSKMRPRVKSRFKGRPLLAGRITDADGSGMSGAPLLVTETFRAGSKPALRKTRTVSDGTGRYRLKLKRGPGRAVTVKFAGTRTRSQTFSRKLTVGTSGKVIFRITPNRLRNGGWVKMNGRVAPYGALLPSRGKLVALQYFDPSRGKWRPVDVVRTSRNGSFRYRYRFRTIASAQRIIFRAVSLSEAGWPYLASTSPSRSVIVYPRR